MRVSKPKHKDQLNENKFMHLLGSRQRHLAVETSMAKRAACLTQKTEVSL